MSNPVFEVVRTVLAVREYQSKEVPDDVLRRVLEAAHLTASASNKQPWHFVLVKAPETLRQLGRLVRTAPYIAEAPAAVVVACEKSNPLAISDTSRAIQSMILTAWAERVGSNWGGFRELDEVRALVGLPEEFQVIAVVPLGYPRRKLGAGKKNRKPFDQVVSAERFGRPLER